MDELRNNRVDSSADVSPLVDALNSLKVEISQMESVLAAMRSAAVVLTKRVDEHRSLAAPIRRLPVEVLESIFSVVCAPVTNILQIRSRSKYIMQRSHRRPFHLAGVCTVWRAIMLASPPYWSCIAINYAVEEL